MGKGKSREVPVAVQKAMEEARRKMRKVSLKDGTLHHTVTGKHGATTVLMSARSPVPASSPAVRCVPCSKSWA
jgi:small subunit ribosomal protein S5